MQRTWWTRPGYSLSRHALVICTRLLLTSECGKRTQSVILTVEPQTIALFTLPLFTAYDQWDQTSNWNYDSSRRSMSSVYYECILQHQFYWKNNFAFSTSSYGAGNQCCYRADGTLIYSGDSYQGSTPDRSHLWGAAPYNTPNLARAKVPAMSHSIHDIMPFYYCCLLTSDCDKYMSLRPTRSCTEYWSPKQGRRTRCKTGIHQITRVALSAGKGGFLLRWDNSDATTNAG